MIKGVIIKESLKTEDILDDLTIESAEIWHMDDKPCYWTAIHFTTEDIAFPKKLSRFIMKNWFCEMTYLGKVRVLVFRSKVMQYTIGNEAEKAVVMKYCRSIGLPEEQMNWDE